MRKETLLAATALLALTAPAGAACLDQVAQLEQRLVQLESGTAGAQQQQQATTAGVQQPQQQQPQQQPAPAASQQQAADPQQQAAAPQQQPATAQQGQATAAKQQPIAGAQQQQPQPADTQQQEPATEETVELTMEGGQEVDVTAVPPGGEGQPQDTWLGGTSPQSLQGAREQLDGARTAAEEGNEAGCVEQLAQAERIIDELEGQ